MHTYLDCLGNHVEKFLRNKNIFCHRTNNSKYYNVRTLIAYIATENNLYQINTENIN